jgi:hypothetical protein
MAEIAARCGELRIMPESVDLASSRHGALAPAPDRGGEPVSNRRAARRQPSTWPASRSVASGSSRMSGVAPVCFDSLAPSAVRTSGVCR